MGNVRFQPKAVISLSINLVAKSMDSISEKQASEICYRNINQPRPDWPDKPEFVVVRVDERKRTWVVYYQSKLWVITGDISHALAGNGPYLVSKTTGEFEIVGSYPPLSDRLEEAEQRLAVRGAFEHTSVPNHLD